jgi:hypothetical protein
VDGIAERAVFGFIGEQRGIARRHGGILGSVDVQGGNLQ